MRRVHLPALLAAALVSLGAAPAAASSGLWATVNVCDTESAPNAMGVRAQMPGNGTRQRMYVRFRAQYYSHDEDGWLPVDGSGRSPWVYVGSARYAWRQAGWTFLFAPPQGQVFLVRAVAFLEWRERRRTRAGHPARWVVAGRAKRVTRGGIRGVDGGDPPGTSRGSCYIFP